MEDTLDLFEFAKPRFGLMLFSVFAAIGLILVSVGVYSVGVYTVSRQSCEIGIGLALGATALGAAALGATTGSVRTLVIMSGLKFILLGVGGGLVLAAILTRVMASQFWGVTIYDPLMLAAVVTLLTAIGVPACYVPSRRATRVDPAISLRYD
jgi:ABC-type antimicrobial peptide transport system permease subunit